MDIPLRKAGSVPDLFSAENRSAKKLLLCAEPVSDWFDAIGGAKLLLSDWQALASAEDIETAADDLELQLNETMIGSLSLQVLVDRRNRGLETLIMASSLKDAIMAQWASATAANVAHRQCRECTKWFGIQPGHGRPEKLYCSDACRMRAYRKSKSGLGNRCAFFPQINSKGWQSSQTNCKRDLED